MRTKTIAIIVVLALVMLSPVGRGAAREVRQGDQCIIGANETITGDAFILCRTLVVNGMVQGNLIGAATKSEINGTVTGDVYLLSGQLDVNGNIGNDLHFAGGVLRIMPSADIGGETGDLISITLSTTLTDGAAIPGSVTGVGYQMILQGDVGREVNFWGSALVVDGTASDNVTATVGDPQAAGISQLQTLLIPFPWDVTLIQPGLIVGDGGVIDGALRYSGPVEGILNGRVEGDTVFTQVITQPDLTQIIADEQGAERGLSVYLGQAAREFVNLALVGIIGLLILPRPLQLPIRNIQSRPLPSVGVGLLTFIVAFPITFIALLLILIVIGIFLLAQLDGLLLGLLSGSVLGLLIGVALSFFFIAIFVSRVVVCLWIGRMLIRAFLGDEASPRQVYITLLLGVMMLALLTPLPVIGWIINAFALFLGIGAIVITLQGQLRVYRDTPPVVPRRVGIPMLPPRDNPRRIPPPALDDQPQALGMDNLPDGFTWWDE